MKITATIRALCSDGRFAGTVTKAEDSTILGMTVFVPNVLPKEVVELEVLKQQKQFLDAQLIKIGEPAANRIEAPCKYFGECGGCNLQHLEIAEQRRLKKDLFLQTYKKITGDEYQGKLRAFEHNLPAYHYRQRINLHWKDGILGFFQVDSNKIIAIDYCMLAQDKINQTLRVLIDQQASFPESLIGVTIEDVDQGVPLVLFKMDPKIRNCPVEAVSALTKLKSKFDRLQIIHGRQVIFSNIKEENSLGHFSQVNPAGNKYLQQLLLKNLKGKLVTELYAGGGNFTFPIHQQVEKVVAVELDRELVGFAQDQIKKLQLKNLHFIRSTAEDFVARNKIQESLVLDPPRAGAKDALQKADLTKTKEIIYISCNPATFARDAKQIMTRGYKLEFIELVDMFPQTAHLELLAKFSI